MSTKQSEYNSTRTDSKRAIMMQAASDLIIERGYEGTNLDAICDRARCSKSSIYAHFGNKEGLLAALTEEISFDLSSALQAFHLQHLSVEETLRRYARLALKLMLNERHIAIVRATISAVWKHPQLGSVYYELGSQSAQNTLAEYFRSQSSEGTLSVSDEQQAAREFQGMLLWDRMLAQIVGARSAPQVQDIEADADAAVEGFLSRYATTA